MKTALLVIDVQRDFAVGGVLPARETGTLVPSLNRVIRICLEHKILCVFTRDWHPRDHCSFKSQGGPWPVHCVQNTRGAEFAEGLFVPESKLVIDIEKEQLQKNVSYSAFENTNLDMELQGRHIEAVALCGIATEYCVLAAAMDALRRGLIVSVLTDIIRPIELDPGDAGKALVEMRDAGIHLLHSREWLKRLHGSQLILPAHQARQNQSQLWKQRNKRRYREDC